MGLDNGQPDLDSLLGGLQGSAGLQFLPHPPSDAAGISTGQQAEQPALFVPADLSGSGPAVLLPPSLDPQLPSASLGTSEEGMNWDDTGPALQQQEAQQQQPSPQQRPQRRQQQQHAARRRPAPPAKQPHSQVEKQRRDRINSLIDELRELVPPQGSEAAATSPQDGAASEGRRPKHVVLADTIRLIKDLQLQLAEGHGVLDGAGGSGISRWVCWNAPEQAKVCMPCK